MRKCRAMDTATAASSQGFSQGGIRSSDWFSETLPRAQDTHLRLCSSLTGLQGWVGVMTARSVLGDLSEDLDSLSVSLIVKPAPPHFFIPSLGFHRALDPSSGPTDSKNFLDFCDPQNPNLN